MEALICKHCGATGLRREKGYWFCEYCESKFLFTKEEENTYSSAFSFNTVQSVTSSQIALSEDVERLLQKCKTDRKNARKYANLILDIDPDNTEALQYL